MHELTTSHLDDFTLLRYVAQDLDVADRDSAANHLRGCDTCQRTLVEIEELDRELRALAADPVTRTDFELEDLSEADPFRRRPMGALRILRQGGDQVEFAGCAAAASEEGLALTTVLLEAVKTSSEGADATLGRLDLSDPAHRFALLYAMQELGKQIKEHPTRFLRFAERVLVQLRRSSSAAESLAPMAENHVVPAALFGQAHQLTGQALLWTGEMEKARAHLTLAYRFFGQAGDLVGLAITELLESQRRSFSGRGAEGLLLTRRAAETFETLGLDDYLARAAVIEGLAFCDLGRHEEAIAAYRRSLPVFERTTLWSNYVGAVNAIATSLVKLGRLAEARREYARALRRFSKERHRSSMGIIRQGLAEVLFAAGRYREAAVATAQAVRAYSESGMLLHHLKASLFEVEAWARAGDLTRARRRFDIFRIEVSKAGALDLSISREIERALSGDEPDFQRVAELRRQASEWIDERLLQRFA